MSEVFDIQQQWFDSFGGLLVNGKVYYGEPKVDTKTNLIDIFSDRELTVPLTNPQTIGADGRVVQKAWLNEKYSILVEDNDAVQVFESEDNGEDPIAAGVITNLTNMTGLNALTGLATGITEYNDLQIFSFTAPSTNTGVMTLRINALAFAPILFNSREQIGNGFIQVGQVVNVIYNSAKGAFFWNDEGRGISLLSNVGGTANAITASGGPSAISNIDKQLYVFKTISENTAAVTLTIDTLAAIDIKYNGIDLVEGDLKALQLVIVAYDSVSGDFNLVSSPPNQFLIQSKMCIPFFGTSTQIPPGFVLCDGNNSTPNLVNGRFLRGADATGDDIGDIGGSITTGGHSITIPELAAHTHTFELSNAAKSTGDDNGTATMQITTDDELTSSTGSGTAHTHPGNEPPFTNLLWIMKI